jgi:hypothetical protein
MSKYHAVSGGMVTRQALPSITRQRGTTTGSANLMLYGAGKTTATNNTTFIDSSANAFTVTRNGDTVQSGFNPFNQASSGAGYFDGAGDYLTVTNASALQLNNTTAFTIECWVYPTSLPSPAYIVENYNQVFPFPGYSLAYNVGGTGTINFWDGGGLWINTGITISLNEWTHIAVTYEGSGSTRRFFKNGVQSGSAGTVSSGINYTAGSCSIGAQEAGITPWLGYISNLRIVNGTAVYTSNFTPPTSPLTAITNTSLLLLTDNYSIVNSTATNIPVTLGNASISTAQFPTGMSSSMSFNGTTSTASVTGLNLSSVNWTIEGFVYFNSFTTTTTPVVFNFGADSNNRYVFFRSSSSGKFNFTTANGGVFVGADGTTSPSTGVWYHFALVKSGSVVTMYINGTSEATNSTAISSGTVWYLGGFGFSAFSNNYLNGYLSNVRICSGTALYTANFTPPSLPMSTTVTVPNFVTNNIYGMNQIP